MFKAIDNKKGNAGDVTSLAKNTLLHVYLGYQVKLKGASWFNERKNEKRARVFYREIRIGL